MYDSYYKDAYILCLYTNLMYLQFAITISAGQTICHVSEFQNIYYSHHIFIKLRFDDMPESLKYNAYT